MIRSHVLRCFIATAIFFSNCNAFSFFSSKLTIENATKTPYYGAIYHTTKKRAVRASRLTPLTPGKLTTLTLPMGKPLRKRKLIIGRLPEDLPQKFESDDEALTYITEPFDVGAGSPDSLILQETEAGVEVSPSDIGEAQKVREYLRKKLAERSPHYDKIATVSQYPDRPSPQEQDYLAQRIKVTRKALSQFTGNHIALSHLPGVSVAAGGGGIRATLMTLGALRGLHRIGLLNGLQYMAGVSGGTWAITSWLLQKNSIEEAAEAHRSRYENIPPKNTLIRQSFSEYNSLRYQKSLFGHGSGLTDLYSICLSKVMLKPEESHYYRLFLSDLASNLHPAQHPFPICTAVSRKNEIRGIEHHWLEFTPFNIRLVTNDLCIPTWSLMRRFDNGRSIDKTPEPWLGFCMGLWGSAFSISLDDVLVRIANDLNRWVPDKVLNWLMKSKFGRKKRFIAKIPNFTYHLDAAGELGTQTLLQVNDSGTESNIPVNSLWHAGRNQDLIIVINPDVVEKFGLFCLKKVKRDLKERFPRIQFDIDAALGQPITYWPSNDPGTPSLLHISLHADETFDPSYNPRTAVETATRNFTYTTAQATRLMDLATHTIVSNKKLFLSAVKDAVQKKEKEGSFFSWLGSRIKGLFVS